MDTVTDMDDLGDSEIEDVLRRVGIREVVKLVALPSTLRAVRGFLGLTQAELCKRCSVSRRTLHKIESGSTNVDYLTLASIRNGLAILGVKLDLKDGELCLTIRTSDVSPTLAKIHHGRPPLRVFGPDDFLWKH